MRAGSLTFAFGLLAVLPSCSLVGLDHFRVHTCGECASLNTRDGIAQDACENVWLCDATGQFCERARFRDEDHDTFRPIACGGTDCNDTSAAISPRATEMCDGVDNDCNGLLDDAAGMESMPVPVLNAPLAISTGYGAADDGVDVVWTTMSGAARYATVSQITTAASAMDAMPTTNENDPITGGTEQTGCPERVVTPLAAPVPCDSGGACTGSGMICVTAPSGERVCETTVMHNVPQRMGECQTHAECDDGIACNGVELCQPTSPLSITDARGCRSAMAAPCGMARCSESLRACVVASIQPCAVSDLAIAPFSPSSWLTAMITTNGCASGRVRPGAFSAMSGEISLWGDDRRTTTWTGVDLDAQGCTGGSRPMGAAAGASGLGIAGLDIDVLRGRTLPQALLAWRASAACPSGACAGPAPVEILGLWHELGPVMGNPVRWANGSDDGHPVRLADATTSARVDVASWALTDATTSTAGYTVAYARSGGGVSLAFVHALSSATAPSCDPACGNHVCDRPMETCTSCPGDCGMCTTTCGNGMNTDPGETCDNCPADQGSCPNVRPACLTADPGPDGVVNSSDDGQMSTPMVVGVTISRTTPALGMPVADVIEMASTPVGDVSLAVGHTDAAAHTVQLAVAFATATEVVVARPTFDAMTDTTTEGMAVRIPADHATEVTVVHLDGGIGDNGASGGFVVTWVGADGTYAARIADATGMLVAPGATHLGSVTTHPRAFLDRSATPGEMPVARVIGYQGDSFVAFPTLCGS